MKSLKKALRVLEVFLDTGDREIRLSDLARLSGLNIATVNRIVSVFVELGYMNQVEKRGRYVLGTRFLNFSAIIKQRSRIRDVAMPHLIKLNKSVGESVALLNWDGNKLVFIDEIYSRHPLRIVPDPSMILPLYCTGVGKIVLADMTGTELEEYFHNTDIQVHTPNTITKLEDLKACLKKVAREGVAYDDEERYLGVRSVGAGIRDAEDEIVACVGVSGLSVRLTREKMTEIAPDIKKCAMQISIDLGYQGR